MLWHEEKTQNVMRNYYFFANRDFVAVYLCFLMLFVHLIVMLLDLRNLPLLITGWKKPFEKVLK